MTTGLGGRPGAEGVSDALGRRVRRCGRVEFEDGSRRYVSGEPVGMGELGQQFQAVHNARPGRLNVLWSMRYTSPARTAGRSRQPGCAASQGISRRLRARSEEHRSMNSFSGAAARTSSHSMRSAGQPAAKRSGNRPPARASRSVTQWPPMTRGLTPPGRTPPGDREPWPTAAPPRQRALAGRTPGPAARSGAPQARPTSRKLSRISSRVRGFRFSTLGGIGMGSTARWTVPASTSQK